MNKEWLTRYYRSLEWSEGGIARFLERGTRGKVSKKKEIEIK
jgi:hypothetical protein